MKRVRFGLLLLSLLLTGCADVAMTGAQAIYNRHSIQKTWHDQYITMQIHKALKIDNNQFNDANVVIATYNGQVLLAGQVPHPWQKKEAEQLAKQIEGVNQVYNAMQIAGPSSTLTRISDAWVTAKVKAKLIASDEVDASQIKVVTENGMVFLMGTIQADEADAAAELARSIDGVESV